MAAPPPPPRRAAGNHTRVSSVDERRVTSPRRRTVGPLDLEDPLSLSEAASPIPSPRPPGATSPAPPAHPLQTPQPTPSITSPLPLAQDFSHLLNPTHFLPLSPLTLPLRPQPPPETPLTELLSLGHFRAAAIKAASLLLSTNPTDYPTIFELWYIRLSCLTLIGATAIAAQEVKHLEDLTSSGYKDPRTGRCLVLWELRVLAVRLQSIGFDDWRSGISKLFELGREGRSEYRRCVVAKDAEGCKRWEARLWDLGVRVGGMLVEMGSWEGAVVHLKGMIKGDGGEGDRRLSEMVALVYLRVGDVVKAEAYVEEGVLSVLRLMVEGLWEEAAAGWRGLIEEAEGKDEKKGLEMYQQNLAVCLFYRGLVKEAQAVLEGLVDAGQAFHTLTFNLSAIYEVCNNDARPLKVQLAEKVAQHGRELPSASFKS
ncbi:hypothetical protein BJ508DRAFT_374917 [Ascobolus immersus RN42]|uniref:TPR-like protein n=1 Tax=Ascobolus immersus RN42 TaxID=1160509 RepID=A0A3N4IHJ5_ASCIM|nr:hypothetical protein BJ508DRAFT_374917 [Ascobolus immersus RN42]